MTIEEANKIGIDINDVHKLNQYEINAFKDVCNKILQKGDNCTPAEMTVYILGKMDMGSINSHILDKTMDEIKALSDKETALYEAHQKYKEYKKQYHNYKDTTEKAIVMEAHKKMTNSLNEFSEALMDLFNEAWSCTECQDEREILNRTATYLYKKCNS